MRVDEYQQIVAIRSEYADKFQNEVNKQMKELAEHNPALEIKMLDGSFKAIITYTMKEYTMDCVADEFHAEGIRYLCKNCPHLEDPHDKRVMRCGCRYAELGTTHKLHEACEVFYKALKNGTITPLEDYER